MAAFRLAGQPFATMPPPCASAEEWLSRYGPKTPGSAQDVAEHRRPTGHRGQQLLVYFSTSRDGTRAQPVLGAGGACIPRANAAVAGGAIAEMKTR